MSEVLNVFIQVEWVCECCLWDRYECCLWDRWDRSWEYCDIGDGSMMSLKRGFHMCFVSYGLYTGRACVWGGARFIL